MSEIVQLPNVQDVQDAQDAQDAQRDELIKRIVELVRGGKLVVIPTDTTYAVIADPFHQGAVDLVRTAKGQASNVSLPIGAGSIETIMGVAHITGLALDLVRSLWPGQLTVMVAPQPSVQLKNVPAGNALSVRVPKDDFSQAVLAGIGPTVMTGANAQGKQMPTTIKQAQEQLGEQVSLYVDGGSLSGAQSSIVDATGQNLRLVREGALSLKAIREVVPMVVNATLL